jgi:hypothetical protein
MFGKILRLISPHPNKEKKVHINIRPPTIRVRSKALQVLLNLVVGFYLLGNLKSLVFSAPTENEDILPPKRILCL